MTQVFLGGDIGGTATRWTAIDASGSLVARGSTGGATGHLFNPVERERFEKTIAEIKSQIGSEHEILGAFFGITGLGENLYKQTQASLGLSLQISPDLVGVSDDMELAFRAVFAPGTGHLISAGTGSIGLHVAGNGSIIRVGGRGLLIDDGGAGTWIALRAIDQLYRRIDETGGPGDAQVLANALFSAIGGSTWDDTRAYVYGSDRGKIGALAQVVAEAATAGDPLALDILDRAGEELARLGAALVKRSTVLPIGYVGGIVKLHPIIKSSIAKALSGNDILFPTIDAAAHAAHMARSAFQQV